MQLCEAPGCDMAGVGLVSFTQADQPVRVRSGALALVSGLNASVHHERSFAPGRATVGLVFLQTARPVG